MGQVLAIKAVTRADYAAQITEGYNRIYRDILELGKMLVDARETLPHGQFLKMIDTDLPFSQRTAYSYIQEWLIANDRNLQPAATLSESYTVRAELERLKPDEIDRGMAAGKLYQGVPRAQVIEFRRELRAAEPHRPRHSDIAQPSAPAGGISTSGTQNVPARTYSEMVWLLIQRRNMLGLTQMELDERIGWGDGMTSKLEIPHMQDGRVAGPGTLKDWLQALGVGLQMVPV